MTCLLLIFCLSKFKKSQKNYILNFLYQILDLLIIILSYLIFKTIIKKFHV